MLLIQKLLLLMLLLWVPYDVTAGDFAILNAVACRVDSFVFCFSFAKYETERNRLLFCRVSIVLRN